MKHLQVLVAATLAVGSLAPSTQAQSGRQPVVSVLRLPSVEQMLQDVKNADEDELLDIAAAASLYRSRARPRLGRATAKGRAYVELGFDSVITWALERRRVLRSYSGNVQSIHLARVSARIDEQRFFAVHADEVLRALHLSVLPPRPPDTRRTNLIPRYPQQPLLEPSWKRAQRAERAQLGTVGRGSSGQRPRTALKGAAPTSIPAPPPVEEDTSRAIPASVVSLAALPAQELSEPEKKYLAIVYEFDAISRTYNAQAQIVGELSPDPPRDYQRLRELWQLRLETPPTKRLQVLGGYINQAMLNDLTAFKLIASVRQTIETRSWKASKQPHEDARKLLDEVMVLLPVQPTQTQ